MRFNWISEREIDDSLRKFCIELEYSLRPRITRFLMERLEYECRGDFSSFHFDVDLNLGQLRIGKNTPMRLTKKIASDFRKEFNRFSFQPA
ncbi:MAG: hypothetical protein KJN96_02420 [Eudoraea sp.]|nr:hypothetical protein [Eudoraea sp.]